MLARHEGRVCLQALPFQQFHVLFHSLFKVLFIFPSLYLFAIGLSPVFSFRWNLPPTLSCIPKQLDSLERRHKTVLWYLRGSHPLRRPVPRDLVPLAAGSPNLQITTPEGFQI